MKAADEEKVESPAGWDADSARVLALLANNIRLLRSQRGMTRKGLAEQSGVSLPHLARLESSQGNVSVVVLGKVAKALNQPVARLFAEEDAAAGDFSVVMEFLKRRSPDQLDRIRRRLLAEFESHGDKAGRIALIGLRGAGKSTVGKELAERLGRPFVELNKEVEREAGISLQEILNFYGQTGYRNLERRCLERLLVTHPNIVLATGGGIVVEPQTYEILLSSFYTVWLHAEHEVYFQRAMGQHDLRIAKPPLYREAMENIRRTMESRDHLYRMADLAVDTTKLSVDQVVQGVIAQVQAQATAPA
ncbi:MAG TPA: helix-turn-helix transcriptional regulator [Rhodocyclaceae bacterium]|nr:helix-turn-helix transcriptional regulator [Rhodocyclaceae bacterium]